MICKYAMYEPKLIHEFYDIQDWIAVYNDDKHGYRITSDQLLYETFDHPVPANPVAVLTL